MPQYMDHHRNLEGGRAVRRGTPSAEAVEAVYREAHGNVADVIVEVKEGS